jgi:hypothetical protein
MDHLTGYFDVPKIGQFQYIITSPTHVCLNATLIVNRVDYKINAHLNLIDGEWRFKDHHALNLRDNKYTFSWKAYDKVNAAILAVWPEFLKEHADLLIEAGIRCALDERDANWDDYLNALKEVERLANLDTELSRRNDQLCLESPVIAARILKERKDYADSTLDQIESYIIRLGGSKVSIS